MYKVGLQAAGLRGQSATLQTGLHSMLPAAGNKHRCICNGRLLTHAWVEGRGCYLIQNTRLILHNNGQRAGLELIVVGVSRIQDINSFPNACINKDPGFRCCKCHLISVSSMSSVSSSETGMLQLRLFVCKHTGCMISLCPMIC